MSDGRTDPPKRRSRWEWSKLIAAWEKSGDSQSGFCRRYGLKLTTFSKWRKRLNSTEEEAVAPSSPFVPITLTGRGTASSIAPFEIVLLQGHVVKFQSGFSPLELQCVLRILEDLPC